MTADNPEAGRTCKPWCGEIRIAEHLQCAGHIRLHDSDRGVTCFCSRECTIAGKPLNPAPRPVETFAPLPDDEFRRAIRDGEEAGRRAMRRQALDEGRPPPIESPLPIERCSCEESQRYAEALWGILGCVEGSPRNRVAVRVRELARRALALGGETET